MPREAGNTATGPHTPGLPRSDWEDSVQEVCLRAVDKIEQLGQEASFPAWLRRNQRETLSLELLEFELEDRRTSGPQNREMNDPRCNNA